jgi:hypothetical protein
MEEKLILKRASASRPSQEWNDDDYDVLSDRSRRVSVENEWSAGQNKTANTYVIEIPL